MVFVNATVRENDDVSTLTECLVCFNKKSVDSLFKACVFIIKNRNGGNLKAVDMHIFDFKNIRRSKNWIMNLNYLTVFRLFFKNVAVLADINCC